MPALSARSRVAGAAAALAVAGAALAGPKDSGPRPPEPDLGFYAYRIAPFLDATCAACHASGGGGYRLAPPLPAAPGGEQDRRAAEEARGRANFEATARFVDRDSPWRSRLVLKVLGEEDGGLPHAGGALLTPDDEAYDDLLDFACGATLANLPPEPEPGRDRRAVPGREVLLDGGESYDRDEDPLTYRWELFVRPPGSRATLTPVDATRARAKFTPDVGGTYVARLRVFDGKVWSAPRPVVLEALDRVGPEAPDPAATSALAAIPPDALRLVRALHADVLGRPPAANEAEAAAKKPLGDVAATLSKTLEAGRAWLEDAAHGFGMAGDSAPTSDESGTLPFRLAGGEISPAAAEAVLVRDPSFQRAHPPGPALARAVFDLLLERPAGRGEEEAVLAACAGRAAPPFLGREGLATPGAVLDAVCASPEFETAALRRFAARFLPPQEARAFPASRRGEPTAALSLSILASPAWAAGVRAGRPKSDLAFVRGAFTDLLGRRPSDVELAALARAVAVIPGDDGHAEGRAAGRGAIVKVLSDSGEAPFPLLVDLKDPGAWIADRFLRLLGRAPSAEEAKAYLAALLDPAGGPDVVAWAILTSAEYALR